MKTMTIIKNGWVFRWSGGSFMPVWRSERADEHVPDDMIELPESINKSKATREDIEAIARRYLAPQSN
jgi:hypothetical protein